MNRKVIRIFGRVIRPANWIIFLAGIALMIASPILGWILKWEFFATFIVWIQGIQLAVEGYGEIKDDEDISSGK